MIPILFRIPKGRRMMQLPFGLQDFHLALSLGADISKHINELELEAFIVALRWITRQPKKHGLRICML